MNRMIQIISIILLGILLILEYVLEINTFIKQGAKIILLVVIPLAILLWGKKIALDEAYPIKKNINKDLKKPLLIGLGLYFLTLFGYLIFKPIIGSDTIINGLDSMGINKSNIIYAAIYISFINSYLEEFFFRGFMFQHFSLINKKIGYLLPSLAFSFYHGIVMFTIFKPLMALIALFGLTLVGIGLTYVNETNKSIINSWIVHIFADLGIVSIGLFILFI